jgi:glycerophosphoryl diester phosphodiesterase
MASMIDHPFFRGLSRGQTLHIAHRGGAAIAPENTLVAFRAAVERYGTDMLELDVQPTADGELVVFHDDTLDRCTDGSGPVAAHTLAQIRRLDAGYRFARDGAFPFRGQGVGVPTLREVLRAFPDLRLNVELKRAGAEEAFAALLRDERALGRVCIGSELDAVGEKLAALLPEACHFYPRDRLAETVIALRSGEKPQPDERFLVLDMPLWFGDTRLVDAAFLRAAEAFGRWVNVWTVDDEAEMRQLVAEGVGGVMTDRPDLLRRVLDERQA